MKILLAAAPLGDHSMFGAALALPKFDHIIGVSGSSLLAAMLAVNISVIDMYSVIRSVSENFPDHSSNVNTLHSFAQAGNLYSNQKLEIILRNIFGNLTFEQVTTKLEIVAFCLNTAKVTSFNKKNSPNLTLVQAILASTNLPGYFEPFMLSRRYYIDLRTRHVRYVPSVDLRIDFQAKTSNYAELVVNHVPELASENTIIILQELADPKLDPDEAYANMIANNYLKVYWHMDSLRIC